MMEKRFLFHYTIWLVVDIMFSCPPPAQQFLPATAAMQSASNTSTSSTLFQQQQQQHAVRPSSFGLHLPPNTSSASQGSPCWTSAALTSVSSMAATPTSTPGSSAAFIHNLSQLLLAQQHPNPLFAQHQPFLASPSKGPLPSPLSSHNPLLATLAQMQLNALTRLALDALLLQGANTAPSFVDPKVLPTAFPSFILPEPKHVQETRHPPVKTEEKSSKTKAFTIDALNDLDETDNDAQQPVLRVHTQSHQVEDLLPVSSPLPEKLHPQASSYFHCPKCKRSYSTESGFKKHQEHHCRSLETQGSPSSQPPHSSPVTPSAREHHVSPSSSGGAGERQFTCESCSKVYYSMSALKMHIRTHTLPCKCEVCGKAFSRMWLLNGHLRTHSGEKPFTCLVCDRAFADRSNLRAHMQTHSQAKRYRCHACGKTFSRVGLLKKHIQSNLAHPQPEGSSTDESGLPLLLCCAQVRGHPNNQHSGNTTQAAQPRSNNMPLHSSTSSLESPSGEEDEDDRDEEEEDDEEEDMVI